MLRALLAAAVLLVALPGSAQAATCTPPAYPGNGEFTSLKVTKTTCAEGSKVARSFSTCRTRKGPAGRCVSKVRGYSCMERRTTVALELTGAVTCKKGTRRVSLSYREVTG